MKSVKLMVNFPSSSLAPYMGMSATLTKFPPFGKGGEGGFSGGRRIARRSRVAGLERLDFLARALGCALRRFRAERGRAGVEVCVFAGGLQE